MKHDVSLEKLSAWLARLARYRVLLFCLAVAAVYGLLLYQISSLTNHQPSADSVAAQSKTAKVPHIDPKIIKQLESLQDNSVNVKTLFNDARSNPFQE